MTLGNNEKEYEIQYLVVVNAIAETKEQAMKDSWTYLHEGDWDYAETHGVYLNGEPV